MPFRQKGCTWEKLVNQICQNPLSSHLNLWSEKHKSPFIWEGNMPYAENRMMRVRKQFVKCVRRCLCDLWKKGRKLASSRRQHGHIPALPFCHVAHCRKTKTYDPGTLGEHIKKAT